jgi:hypothetical protein
VEEERKRLRMKKKGGARGERRGRSQLSPLLSTLFLGNFLS